MADGAPGGSGLCVVPELLEFYYGSYNGPSFYLHLDGRVLTYEASPGGVFSGKTKQSEPSPEAWEKFLASVTRACVFDWLPEYTTAHGCCQVTYWQLALQIPGRRVASRGSDSRPGPSPACPDPLGSVLHAVRRLAGDEAGMAAPRA